jgi:hypothetical protein
MYARTSALPGQRARSGAVFLDREVREQDRSTGKEEAMRTLKWNAFLSGLCACALMVGAAGNARADVTVEKGSSVVTFPYLYSGHGVRSIVQLTNTGNNLLHVSCYYVRTLDYYTPVWEETDFDLWLTKQQPTVWEVGYGRRYDPFDDMNGFDVSVPPMGYFTGELKCFEISPTGEPLTGNHLKGEVTIMSCDQPYKEDDGVVAYGRMDRTFCDGPHDIAKYNAIGIEGNPDAQGFNPLQLDGDIYAACPEQTILNFVADGSVSKMGNLLPSGYTDNTTVHFGSLSYLTLVPCTEDFENQQPTTTTVQFLIYNEYEQRFSASTTVDCWFDWQLSLIDSPTLPQNSVFSVDVLGSDVGTAWITPVGDGDAQPVIGVLTQEVFTLGALVKTSGMVLPRNPGAEVYPIGRSVAMNNLHTTGNLPAQITLTAH